MLRLFFTSSMRVKRFGSRCTNISAFIVIECEVRPPSLHVNGLLVKTIVHLLIPLAAKLELSQGCDFSLESMIQVFSRWGKFEPSVLALPSFLKLDGSFELENLSESSPQMYRVGTGI
jgi:hypothetical protein